MESNRFNLLADLEASLWAITQAVSTLVATIQRPSYKQALLHPVKSPVHTVISPVHNPIGHTLDRSTIVRLKLEELRWLSSPSHPHCFRCGDRDHRASACRNAALCFACNGFGHRSLHCRAVLEPPHTPPTTTMPAQPLPINTLTTAPLPLTAPDAGSGSSEQSVTDKVLVMDPIKRLERELAMINQEMKMMRKQKSELEKELVGKSDQLHRTQKELAEMVVAQVVMRHVQREKQKRQDEIDKGTQSNEIGSELCVNSGLGWGDRKVILHSGRLRPRKSRLRVRRLLA